MTDMPNSMRARVIADLAPSGTLRAAINLGNPVLAHLDKVTGTLSGVSVELAQELGRRLGVVVTLVPFDAAGKVFAAIKAGSWDVAFLGIDPMRATEIIFTAPYVIIEGGYMVREESALLDVLDVDQDGVTIAAGKNTAYDLYLTRNLKRATLIHAPTSLGGIDLFLDGGTDVVAGIRKPLLDLAAKHKGLRVLNGRFMVIEQAMGTLIGRDDGARYLHGFIEEMKASGFVAEALAESGQADAFVAPLAPGVVRTP